MTGEKFPALVETDWLELRRNDQHIRILDASYYVPGGVEPARKQYLDSHIPGAIFFDINDVAEPSARKEHAFPSAEVFARKVGALGISNESHIVAYDHLGGTCAAARVWFMFRAFGHNRISVMNGGRTKWVAEGRAMDSEVAVKHPAKFEIRGTPLLKSKEVMRSNIETRGFQVLDARGKGRFEGTEPEPRPGLRSGHIPGSLNLPFLQMIGGETKSWKDTKTIRELFIAAGVDLGRPLTTTCGSGVSACTLALGAHLIGKSDVAIYDGSWVDWGCDPDVPVTTGPAERIT